MRLLLAVFCLALLGAGLLTGSAQAEDEGSPSSVYLVFDAETGELVQVDDLTQKRKHLQEKEAIASGTEAAQPGDTAVAKPLDPKIALGGALLVLLLVGFAWLKRSRGKSE